MSDNEDLLGDDLADQSLADYNLGNEEEDQLLADDYESGGPQNVPVSIGDGYSEVEMIPNDYQRHEIEYATPPMQYQSIVDAESVVPNITVEAPNMPPHAAYAPEPRHYQLEHAVPPAIPSGPIESPQIVPSEAVNMPDVEGARERFVAERPVGAQRMPQVRDLPDTLDKVVIPRGFLRGRTSWRAPHFNPRFTHPYRRNNTHRGNFNQRNSFPTPQQVMRPNIPQQIIRQEIRPEPIRPDAPPDVMTQDMIRPDLPPPELHRPEIRPEFQRPEIRPEFQRPEIRPDLGPNPQMGPEISPERPILPDMSFRPHMERPPFQPMARFQFRPEERPMFHVRPNFERPMYPYPRQFNPRFGLPMREIVANSSHMPQVTIRQVPDKVPGNEPEVRMLPVSLPPHLPTGGLAGKKVLINPHFKGNFQPPVEGLPAYIPTRIQKSPPLSPTNKFGPIKDIDDAAERFIAEQRNALARAAQRKFPPRRSPQRYIENTTIEIENELAGRPPLPRRRSDDDDLLRRQEEFINANRAGLRRRMRSPSPPGVSPVRRSPSPRRMRNDRSDPPPRTHHDEDNDYKRRLREQESLRERVLRAKEVRRRKNAVALHRQMQDRERENQDKSQQQFRERDDLPPAREAREPLDKPEPPQSLRDNLPATEQNKPHAAQKTPERKSLEKEMTNKPKITQDVTEKEKISPVKPKENISPVKPKENISPVKTKENISPAKPREEVNSSEALTPPLAPATGTPPWGGSEDDDLDMILGDIDGILSDDEDCGRFKDKPPTKVEPPKPRPPVADLRAKLPPKHGDNKPPRQKIVFEKKEEPKRKDKTPPRRALVSSTRVDDSDNEINKSTKAKKTVPKQELSTLKSRQRITFDKKEKETEKEKPEKTPPFNNRRVILQRKNTTGKDMSVFSRMEADRTQPSAGIFSRAVRIALNDKMPLPATTKSRQNEPQIEYESDSEVDEDELLNEEIGNVAVVDNLPHGMTDTRLRTLAGNDVQTLTLDKQERSATIAFKTTTAAEGFKRKFNNKMVAASRLTVSLQ